VDLRTIVTLARAVQARDPYAAGRSERVTRLAQRIAGELGFGVELNHAIAVGVVCADIGKIGLPDRLLQGRGQLSDEDYATLRSYPAMSSYILGELDLPAVLKEHHRRAPASARPRSRRPSAPSQPTAPYAPTSPPDCNQGA
jgi:putative two-component system response regulator